MAPLAAVERHEIAAVTAAFLLFFCVMSGFFSIRPVRDTVGSMMSRESLANLWMVVWAVSLAVIPLYGWLVSRFRRSVFLPWTYAFVVASLIFVGISMRDGQPGVLVGQFFWVFMSVLNLFIISVFWSFLLVLLRSDQTKRLFGVIAAGGTAGALTGPLFTDFTVEITGTSGVLFIGAGLFTGAIICQRLLLKIWRGTGEPAASAAGAPVRGRETAIGGNPLAGVAIVARSPY